MGHDLTSGRPGRPHRHDCAQRAQQLASLLPDAIEAKLMETAGVDRLAALTSAIDVVRRGGTISLIGVYGGAADPRPMLVLFDADCDPPSLWHEITRRSYGDALSRGGRCRPAPRW